ncbi:MAG: hypothetical protein MUE72_07155 [Chitinophagaceae bacterium]|jgi:hypothetical protein|nr:hypothetical protein [Chitinophagaceae bacterium]
MKIGKYDITLESKAVYNAIFNYALVLTVFILFTDNTAKQSLYIALCTSVVPFIWNTFWFNYYKNKKTSNKQNAEGVFR